MTSQEPIAPKMIPVTEDDGRLDQRWLPDRLASDALEPEVDLTVLFDNSIAGHT